MSYELAKIGKFYKFEYMNLYTEIKNSIDKLKINDAEIFEYEFSPNKDLYEYYFLFLYQSISKQNEIYNLNNLLFSYRNNTSINASAHGKHNLILINSGLINNQIYNIIDNKNLKDYYSQYFVLENQYKFDIVQIIFEFSLLFTIYHEYAHLLQNNQNNNFINEEYKEIFDFERHALEIDADIFSSIHIARHIEEFFLQKSFKENIQEILEKITLIICSNLFYYIGTFSNSKTDIYYEKNTHPHPFIRITKILSTICKYLTDSYHLKSIKFQFNSNYLIKAIIEEIKKLEKVYDTDNFNRFRINIVEEEHKIISYLEKIRVYKLNKLYISSLEVYNSATHIKRT